MSWYPRPYSGLKTGTRYAETCLASRMTVWSCYRYYVKKRITSACHPILYIRLVQVSFLNLYLEADCEVMTQQVLYNWFYDLAFGLSLTPTSHETWTGNTDLILLFWCCYFSLSITFFHSAFDLIPYFRLNLLSLSSKEIVQSSSFLTRRSSGAWQLLLLHKDVGVAAKTRDHSSFLECIVLNYTLLQIAIHSSLQLLLY